MSGGQDSDVKPNPVGRPPKPFNRNDAQKLMSIWCTKEEISGFFGMSVATLERNCYEWAEELGIPKGNFETLRNIFGGEVKASLRRTQIKEALNGNTTLLVWLGKQMLGQADHHVNQDAAAFSVAYSLDDLE